MGVWVGVEVGEGLGPGMELGVAVVSGVAWKTGHTGWG